MAVNRIHKGFTLIELLVALVIIGVLASVSVPTYNQYATQSKLMEAVTLTHSVRDALVDTHMRKGRFLDANSGDLSARNHYAGLGDTDSYQTDTINAMWIGLDNANGHIAHIVVDLNDSMDYAGVSSIVGLRSRVTYDISTQSYTLDCNIEWYRGIKEEYLNRGC